MRKVKITLQHRVPSWNMCNYDGFTADGRTSKDTCRFCQKTKEGYKCLLYDEQLRSDSKFVYKTKCCVTATAGYAVTADEPVPEGPIVDPKKLISETLKVYRKTYNDLLKQGYPRQIAEQIAAEYMIGD